MLQLVIFKYCGAREVHGWFIIPETAIEKETIEEIIASIQSISVNALEIEVEASSVSKTENADGNNEPHDVSHSFLGISYSFHEEEFIAGLQYNAPALDYEKLWYGEKKNVPAEYALEGAQEYASTSDMLTAQEAEATFREIQYHAILGTVHEMNGDERRKFDLWIKFNPALFKLFESLQGLTREVNYGML